MKLLFNKITICNKNVIKLKNINNHYAYKSYFSNSKNKIFNITLCNIFNVKLNNFKINSFLSKKYYQNNTNNNKQNISNSNNIKNKYNMLLNDNHLNNQSKHEYNKTNISINSIDYNLNINILDKINNNKNSFNSLHLPTFDTCYNRLIDICNIKNISYTLEQTKSSFEYCYYNKYIIKYIYAIYHIFSDIEKDFKNYNYSKKEEVIYYLTSLYIYTLINKDITNCFNFYKIDIGMYNTYESNFKSSIEYYSKNRDNNIIYVNDNDKLIKPLSILNDIILNFNKVVFEFTSYLNELPNEKFKILSLIAISYNFSIKYEYYANNSLFKNIRNLINIEIEKKILYMGVNNYYQLEILYNFLTIDSKNTCFLSVIISALCKNFISNNNKYNFLTNLEDNLENNIEINYFDQLKDDNLKEFYQIIYICRIFANISYTTITTHISIKSVISRVYKEVYIEEKKKVLMLPLLIQKELFLLFKLVELNIPIEYTVNIALNYSNVSIIQKQNSGYLFDELVNSTNYLSNKEKIINNVVKCFIDDFKQYCESIEKLSSTNLRSINLIYYTNIHQSYVTSMIKAFSLSKFYNKEAIIGIYLYYIPFYTINKIDNFIDFNKLNSTLIQLKLNLKHFEYNFYKPVLSKYSINVLKVYLDILYKLNNEDFKNIYENIYLLEKNKKESIINLKTKKIDPTGTRFDSKYKMFLCNN